MKKLLLVFALLAASLPSRMDADQPTYDFDFGSLLYGPPAGNDQQTTLAVDSIGGNDANAGTLPSPKLTLPTSLASDEKLGLYRGSLFRSSVPLTADTIPNGVSVRGLSLARGALPVISALDPMNNSAVTVGGPGNTYVYQWTAQDSTVTANGYHNVYVVEINTATEAAQPIASRRRMIDVTSAAAVVAGSVFVESLGNNQWRGTFRPTDSVAPGSGSYRYEVVARFGPIAFPQGVTGSASFSGLELVGSSNGYGGLTGPTGTVVDSLIVLHATTHNAVLGGGSLQRSLFYEQGNQSGNGPSIQLAWYAPDASGLSWETNRCLFYSNVGDRVANGIISHSGNGTNYDHGDIADTAFIGARWSDGSLHGTAIDYVNVAAGTINHVYVQAINEIFGYNMPLATEVENSVFRDVKLPRVGGSFHDNIVLAQSASDPTGNANYPRTLLLQQNGASVTNNLLWSHALAGSTVGANDQAQGMIFDPSATTGTVQHNIMILDPVSTVSPSVYANFPAGTPTGFAIDYNLVISLSKAGLFTLGGVGNKESWADYQAGYPTLDQHSMFVDLSNDPRGLQALFVDPINGDFRWAQTEIASQCAAYCRANHVGPATVTSRWPVAPSVDEAVAAISLLPPKITSPGAITFTKGAYGEYQITTDLDGTLNAPTSYSVAGQPAWLSVNASNGVLSGTPPQTGNFSLSIGATNKAGTGNALLNVTVQTAFMAWQHTYFTAAEINDPAVSGTLATPAGDGIANLIKYALGFNPKIDATSNLPMISFSAVGDAEFLTLTYNKSLAASDVTYTVEVSSDLQAWSSGANATATVSATNNAAGTTQTVVQRDLMPTSSAGRRFIRLKISQP